MEIQVKDVLTSASIIISAVALTYSWKKDRKIRSQIYADKFRNAVCQILAKIERLQILSLSLYDKIQTIYVETSEVLLKNFDIEMTRDYYWKEFNRLKQELNEAIICENIENAYIELYSYHQNMRTVFIKALDEIKEINNKNYDNLLTIGQKAIFSFHDKEEEYHSADLGNILRTINLNFKINHCSDIERIIEPIRELLNDLLVLPDNIIIEKKFPILKMNHYRDKKNME